MKATIFKYLSEEGAISTIKDNSILLRTPSEFNDPFDCYYYISKKERRKSFKLFMNYQFFKVLYKEMVVDNKKLALGKLNDKVLLSNLKLIAKSVKSNKKYKSMPDIGIYYRIAKYLSHKSDDEYKKDFDKMIDGIVDKIMHHILVSCFSLRNDSILMWSHYAQSHRGACVEYEIDDDDFKEVRYSKKLESFQLSKILEIIFGHEFSESEIDYSDEANLFAVQPVFKKFKDWKYEKEVRCAYSFNEKHSRIHDGKDRHGNNIRLFDMPVKIRKIYIGCEANEDFIKKVEELNCDAPIVRMRRLSSKYGVLPIDDTNKDHH